MLADLVLALEQGFISHLQQELNCEISVASQMNKEVGKNVTEYA